MHLSTVETVLEYEVRSPSHCCFNLEAAHWPGQRIVSEQLLITPGVEAQRFCDPLSGNRVLRFDAQPGPLRVHYKAQVEVQPPPPLLQLGETPLAQLPDEVFRHLLPTRYCESDVLALAAQKMFGPLPPGLARVQAIVDWVHAEVSYLPGSTNSCTTARDVFVQRSGVCRDFAHLAITLCRALNIPARLVVGYVWFDEPPQDFHAIFEAWLDGRWVAFDPTGMAPPERLVRVGTGGDAKDVAFATLFGDVQMQSKQVRVLELDARSAPGEDFNSGRTGPAGPACAAAPARQCSLPVPQ